MAHAPLITRAKLPRYGLAPEFLAQFDVRPLEVQIVAGGALGTMAARWRALGSDEWSEPVTSSTRAPWGWSPPGAFTALSFAAGTYGEGVFYTVDEAGTVTSTGTGLTATRYDCVDDAIAAATGEAIMRMRPKKEPSITAWGAEIERAVAMLVRYLLKDLVGFAPTDANVADFQIKDAAREARELFDKVGRGELSPWEMTDSSASGKGNVLTASMESDTPAWDC